MWNNLEEQLKRARIYRFAVCHVQGRNLILAGPGPGRVVEHHRSFTTSKYPHRGRRILGQVAHPTVLGSCTRSAQAHRERRIERTTLVTRERETERDARKDHGAEDDVL